MVCLSQPVVSSTMAWYCIVYSLHFIAMHQVVSLSCNTTGGGDPIAEYVTMLHDY